MYAVTEEMRSAARACSFQGWAWTNAIPAIWAELFRQKYGEAPELPFYAGEGDLEQASYAIAEKLFDECLRR